MTLSPDADKAQVRQAVIELQQQMERLATEPFYRDRDKVDELGGRLEEAERRIELLSNALRSTLTSREEPASAPRPVPEPKPGEREWRPIGDGEKYWSNPQGFSTPADQVPEDSRARFQRERGMPIAEDIP